MRLFNRWLERRHERAMADCAAGRHRMSWWRWHAMTMPGMQGMAVQGWFSMCIVCRGRYDIDGRTTRPPGLWTLGFPWRVRRRDHQEKASDVLHPERVQAGSSDNSGCDGDSAGSA